MSDTRGHLQRVLGCQIERRELYEQALTHRSASVANNERLEFLGDALLGFVIADALWRRYPDADEGELSRRRSSLVNKESLAGIARDLALGDHLRLGGGELRTGGFTRDSILADALEAILAATLLDRGFDEARNVILSVFEERLDHASETVAKDPKTQLQELLQARKRPLPTYEVLRVMGDQHDQHFVVRCSLLDDERTALGEGRSRKRAEQHAALAMLESIAGQGTDR